MRNHFFIFFHTHTRQVLAFFSGLVILKAEGLKNPVGNEEVQRDLSPPAGGQAHVAPS